MATNPKPMEAKLRLTDREPHACGADIMHSEANSQTVRAGAYARYSSDNQSGASIGDQVRICRREFERHGWDLVEGHNDAALSGASLPRPWKAQAIHRQLMGGFALILLVGGCAS